MNKRLPEAQRAALRAALEAGRKLRVVEAHNAFSSIVASQAKVDWQGTIREFDGLWVSSLTSSAAKGLPDMEIYMMEDRMETIRDVVGATDKFVIVDGDTGGSAVAFEYFCALLERIGVSAVVIEDKRHPKRNSLSLDSTQHLEDSAVFAEKIRRGKAAVVSQEFMVFARLEGLIVGSSVGQTLERAQTYIAAGADGILVHSRESDSRQVYEFAQRYNAWCKGAGVRKPLACVPTTYNAIPNEDLFDQGYNIVIHANHLLRAAHLAMQTVCETILRDDRTLGCDLLCSSVKAIFDETGYTAALHRQDGGLIA